MKFLIAGLGSIGRRHLRNLLALSERDILLYRTNKSTLPDDELAPFPVETDLTQALAHKPDAVIIANPTAYHLDVAIPAAQAGCHIMLEKPVSHSLNGTNTLLNTANASGSRILVGYQFRYHPTLNKARELIQDGTLGKVLAVRAHWGEYLPNWHPWEDYRDSYAARADLGGGVIGTLAHPLDYLRFILGEISAVSSLHGHISPLDMDVEDVAEIGLQFANGAVGSVHVNYVQRPPVHQLEIVGTQGTLHWDNAEGVLHASIMPDVFGEISASPSPAQVTRYAPPDGFERNDLFLAQTRHFIRVVEGKDEPICNLTDGIRVQQVVEAAHQSNRQGKRIAI